MSAGYLYFRVSTSQKFDLEFRFDLIPGGLVMGVSVLCVLWFSNLSLEIAKWKYLLKPMMNISWATAAKSVLTGQTVGVFTPNRMGEYIGKVLFVDYKVRIKAIFSSIVGSFAQFNVTLIAGFIGITWYLFNYYEGGEPLRNTFIVLSLGIMGFSLLMYFNLALVAKGIKAIKYLSFLRRYIIALEHYHFHELLIVLCLSMCRYIIFSGQFVLLLYMFGSDLPLHVAWLATTSMYLVNTALPTLAFLEFNVRSSVAVFFFTDELGLDAIIPTSASLTLWLTNIILPAAFGILFIFETRLFNGRNS